MRDGFGPPDLVVRSPEYTMAAEHQDVWWRPASELPIIEPKWVKLVEIRPSSLKARRVIHHSIAHLVLKNDPEAVNRLVATGGGRGGGGGGVDPDDIVNSRPNPMEWAIGKGYDLYRPGTGNRDVPAGLQPDGAVDRHSGLVEPGRDE